jgi:hypothetical protein
MTLVVRRSVYACASSQIGQPPLLVDAPQFALSRGVTCIGSWTEPSATDPAMVNVAQEAS